MPDTRLPPLLIVIPTLALGLVGGGPATAQRLYYAPPSAGVVGAVAPMAVHPPPPPVLTPIPPDATQAPQGGAASSLPPTSPVATAPLPKPAPVTATALPPTAHPMGQRYYQVKSGGRLATVARLNHVAYADLVRLNPHLDPKRTLPAGTLVALPSS